MSLGRHLGDRRVTLCAHQEKEVLSKGRTFFFNGHHKVAVTDSNTQEYCYASNQ